MSSKGQNGDFISSARQFLRDAGYLPEHLVEGFSFSFPAIGRSDFFARMGVPLVAFAGSPHTMRTACVAAIDQRTADQPLDDSLRALRFLATPVAIVRTDESVQWWPIRPEGAHQPIVITSPEQWQHTFATRISDFDPERITAAKQGQQQLFFVDPSLHEWAAEATSDAVRSILSEATKIALEVSPKATSEQENRIIHLVFQLFAARVLQDKKILECTTSPIAALQSASRKYPGCFLPSVPQELREAAQACYKRLSEAFNYGSVNSDMLGHVYENTLVSPEHRMSRGIFYTPQAITSYILNSLPIESIPLADRVVYDPCCGSGSFLLSAFERLSSMLPPDWTPARRHTYLRSHLVGTDLDAFAVGITRLSLVLADPTTQDGWNVEQGDALNQWTFTKAPRIVVSNPPFREIKRGSRRETAADIVQHIVKSVPQESLIGVVLPLSTLESSAAADMRKTVLSDTSILQLALLPSGMFYSAAETAIWLLRKSAKRRSSSVLIRELKTGDVSRFNTLRQFSRTYPANQDAWQQVPQNEFVFSPLLELWERVESQSDTLGNVANINTGLQVKKDDKDRVSSTPRNGDKPFVARLEALRPFAFLCDHDLFPYRWIDFNPAELRRPGNLEMYEKPKVLINSNRNPGSAWRIVAAPARKPVYFSDNFHGLQPRNPDVTIEIIAAVLNSHVANGWLDAHSRKRKLVIATLEQMPFPRFSSRDAEDLTALVRQFEKTIVANYDRLGGLFDEEAADTAQAVDILQAIDGVVFRCYGMSSAERTTVERLMGIDKRPG